MKLEFTFLLGILTTLLGVYYKLFQKVIELSTQEPWSFVPIFYSVIHFIVLYVILQVLILLYHKSKDPAIVSEKDEATIRSIERFLAAAWIPLTLYSLVMIFASEIIGSFQKPELPSIITIGGAAFIVILIFKDLPGMSTKFLRNLKYVPILCITHTFVLSQFSSNVLIKTDKEFYLDNESIQLSIVPTGYIFLPSVKYALYGFHDTLSLDYNGNALIDSVALNKISIPRLEVEFEPQILKFKLKKYLDIKVAHRG